MTLQRNEVTVCQARSRSDTVDIQTKFKEPRRMREAVLRFSVGLAVVYDTDYYEPYAISTK